MFLVRSFTSSTQIRAAASIGHRQQVSMAAQGRQGQWSKKGLDLRRPVVAMQSMLIVSDLDAADHFEIHHHRDD